MKLFLYTLLVLVLVGVPASAQRNVTPAIDRDPIMEVDAKHNLDVARQAYAPLKKAYKQVLMRFEETYAAYPEFSNIDEFLYLAGMSSYYLSENKGKQKVDLRSEKEKEKYAPDKLRADAIAYLSTVVDKHPESKFVADSRKILSVIKTDK